MQQNKAKKFNGELESILKNDTEVQSKLEKVVDLFIIKKQLSVFDDLKKRGHEVSKLLYCLVLLPFYCIDNIFSLVKLEHVKENKDAYYTIKNNERIDWRKLLILFAKRFRFIVQSRKTMQKQGITAIIGDDSSLPKTGKKMENISMVHDHVTNTFILGFKILVVGYWDGGNFIPLDFSIHREKGSKLKKAKESCRSAKKAFQRAKDKFQKASITLQHKKDAVSKHRIKVKSNSTNTNLKHLETSVASEQKAKSKVADMKKAMEEKQSQYELLKAEQTKILKKHPEYGLSRKEKKQQFKKNRQSGSCGETRKKEADESKINIFITMIKRAVKNGFVPDYVLTDTWFFCQELLKAVHKLSSKGVKLLSMAKMGNTTYTLVSKQQTLNAHSLLKIFMHKAKYSRKLKAHYIKIPVTLSGIRINLFFVKIGQRGTWRLLVTNDLSLEFIQVMEIYQLRWSIEVFFKECKQYLNLGGSCSSDFDGQIADATLCMIQHIMLTFFKRMNYQQSFGELFKQVSNETMECTLAEKLWELFLDTINVMGEILQLDIMELQQEAMRNEKTMKLMKYFIFQKNDLKNAA